MCLSLRRSASTSSSSSISSRVYVWRIHAAHSLWRCWVVELQVECSFVALFLSPLPPLSLSHTQTKRRCTFAWWWLWTWIQLAFFSISFDRNHFFLFAWHRRELWKIGLESVGVGGLVLESRGKWVNGAPGRGGMVELFAIRGWWNRELFDAVGVEMW